MRPLRRQMQMVFQDPYASLNPRKRVSQIIGDPLRCQGVGSAAERRRRVHELLERVGLSPSTTTATRTSSRAGSGSGSGSPARSRCEPTLIVADEPVSALDVSIQAQIVNLLADLQEEFGLSYLFVAHDIGVVRHVSDRIAVMYQGKIVEQGTADQVCEHPEPPLHPALLARSRSRTRARPAPGSGRLHSVTLPLSPRSSRSWRRRARSCRSARSGPTSRRWTASGRSSSSTATTSTSSRGGAKSLGRYFPELSFAPGRYVLDGELVIRDADGGLEFDALQSRIHPAESRINLLAKEIPANFVAFDLLAEDDESLLDAPLRERRARLEALAERRNRGERAQPDPARAEEWMKTTEGDDGEGARRPLEPGKRRGMAKVKREREIDCVVLGWRPGKEEGTVGSLILGLYDGGDLRPVGHISGFTAPKNVASATCSAPLETGEQGTAEPSRWTGGRDLEWVALRPELVIEVGYDHASAGRIRHGARFRRFRDDKDPAGVPVRGLGRRVMGGGVDCPGLPARNIPVDRIGCPSWDGKHHLGG